MSDFHNAFEEVIALEVGPFEDGGYTNDPLDAGGETKWGISKRANPELDIKNLTRDQAEQVYWKKYWNPLLLGQIDDRDIATEIFEQAVNLGNYNAVCNAQQSVDLCDGTARLVVDGRMGPVSVAAINKLGQRRKHIFLKCMNGLQFAKYVDIVKNNPSQVRYFVGWLKRVSVNGKND